MTSVRAHSPRGAGFPTTRWSLVLALKQNSSREAEKALAELCQIYWYPLYVYVRKRGHSSDDAQDLTQAFFAEFLRKRDFEKVDPNKGRLRTYLLTSLQNFIRKTQRKTLAMKRGGHQSIVSWDQQATEDRLQAEPADELTPETAFERKWAATVVERAVSLLREEFSQKKQSAAFDHLASFLWGDKVAPYKVVADQVQMSVGAFKVAVHRLRRRYREILRGEIADTVANPDEVEEELRHLINVISG